MVTHARRLPVAVALLALFFAACGGDDAGDAPTATGTATATAPQSASDFPPSNDPARSVPESERGTVNAFLLTTDVFVGENNFVFGVTDANDTFLQSGAKARATFYDLTDSTNPKPVFQAEAVPSAPAAGAVTEHVHANGTIHLHGGKDTLAGYFVPVTFDHAGLWGVAIEAILADGTRGLANLGFSVTEEPAIPAPGDQAIASDNLTKNDVTDIRMIDSGDPPNDMHDVKIKDALAAGRPLVIVFATPAYCVSRFCGPTTEEVEDLQVKYGDRVDFVHIEIWYDFQKQIVNPTALEWLQRTDGDLHEPYVYVVDREGTIFDRWQGPVAVNIMEASVQAVADGATYTP